MSRAGTCAEPPLVALADDDTASRAETTKVSQNVSDALHAVCEHDSAATFEAYAFKVAVAGSWDQALVSPLGTP